MPGLGFAELLIILVVLAGPVAVIGAVVLLIWVLGKFHRRLDALERRMDQNPPAGH